MLRERYGVKGGYELEIENYRAYKQETSLYLIMNVNGRKEQELSELKNISEQLRTFGDKEVPVLLATNDGKTISEWQGNNYCLLQYENIKPLHARKMGKKLARFHFRGRHMPFPVESIKRIGQWKELWEKRLDQMEGFWNGKLNQGPENEFEKMFFDSFPYYMGLTENAVQYLIDTELDIKPEAVDTGTVCHERCNRQIWGREQLIKNPYDWVFDHASRDLAEYIRERYFYNSQTYQPEIRKFMAEYQQVNRLSPFSWRLLFARLMFPLHYFECIEAYYISTSETEKRELEEKLYKYLKQSSEQEQFLGRFYQLVEAPVRTYKLPTVKWLIK